MRGYGRSHIPAVDFTWSLDLLVDDLFAVADAAGLQRFHLVGESIGGTVALAAAVARPDRIATLTVSNGAHLGASIQRAGAWRRQLEEGGSKAWSDAFMRGPFPRRRAVGRTVGLVCRPAGKVVGAIDSQCTRCADRRRSLLTVEGHPVPDPAAAS